MTEPLALDLTVHCSPAHAFEVWAQRTAQWWPSDHTVGGERAAAITFEPRAGGRIFERTSAGVEHDWGEVIAWEPPGRLVYLWHIGDDRSEATEVEITFTPAEDGTRVAIEHRGWERLGATAEARRDGNERGWGGVLPLYERACLEPA